MVRPNLKPLTAAEYLEAEQSSPVRREYVGGQVYAEALKLSLEERAEVANLLLESLENPTLEEASQVWGEIAAGRYQEMKTDKSKVVELGQVLRNVKYWLE